MTSFSLNDLHDLCARTEKLGEVLCRLLARYRIGDQVRVVQYKGLDTAPEEDREECARIVGQTFTINDIDFWEAADQAEHPYHVTYRIDIEGDCENGRCGDTFFLDEDEIEPAAFGDANALATTPAAEPPAAAS